MEELKGDDLKQFLLQHDLLEYAEMDGIGWRSHKLQFALTKNAKLINPSLDAEK